MNRFRNGLHRPFFNASATPVAKDTVKLCALCGTLNHEKNAECWTCRWRGEFSRDEQHDCLAWQRLEALYEDVRLEHVTASKPLALGDLGTVRPVTGWQAALNACRAWWRNFQTRRDLRMAQRAASLRSRIPSRPGSRGV